MKKAVTEAMIVCIVFSLFSLVSPTLLALVTPINLPTETQILPITGNTTLTSQIPNIGNFTRIYPSTPQLPPNKEDRVNVAGALYLPCSQGINPLTDPNNHWLLLDLLD